jgi:3-oxoadipate enol-lactonase
MRPAIDALTDHFRVITFSLCREPTRSPGTPRPGDDFDVFVAQIEAALNDRGLATAIICGVSFGGLIALRFASRRPQRTSKLVLVSTPGPGWRLKARHELYARLPWIFGPIFLAEAPWRLRKELRAAIPDAAARRRFGRSQLRTFIEAPLSLARMAARARLIGRIDAAAECARISAPTLVVTGKQELDHVVPANGTSLYATLIAGARLAVLEDTGHLGSITRPRAFASVLRDFAGTTSTLQVYPLSAAIESTNDAA